MKKVVLIIVVILFVANLSATEFKHSLGFAGGMISGSGFAYRQMNENYGFQVTFGILANNGHENYGYDGDYHHDEDFIYSYDSEYWTPETDKIYSEYGENLKNLIGNIGVSYYKPLHRGKKSMFYLLAGSSVYFAKTEDKVKDFEIEILSDSTYHYVVMNDEYNEVTKEIFINTGIGIGMEYQIFYGNPNLKISLEWPLVFQKSEDNYNIVMYIPQAGIHYYF